MGVLRASGAPPVEAGGRCTRHASAHVHPNLPPRSPLAPEDPRGGKGLARVAVPAHPRPAQQSAARQLGQGVGRDAQRGAPRPGGAARRGGGGHERTSGGKFDAHEPCFPLCILLSRSAPHVPLILCRLSPNSLRQRTNEQGFDGQAPPRSPLACVVGDRGSHVSTAAAGAW